VRFVNTETMVDREVGGVGLLKLNKMKIQESIFMK